MPAHVCRDCGVIICRLGIAVWMKAKVDKKQSARVQLRCREGRRDAAGCDGDVCLLESGGACGSNERAFTA